MNITALNIGANVVRALSIQGTTVKKQEIVLAPGSVRNGLILQPEITAKEIRKLFNDSKLYSGRVVCALNGLPFSYRMLAVPKMEQSACAEAVLRTARKEMSISPEEMYLSWQAYPAENDEWQVLAAGITRRPVDNLIKTLSAAGIRPYLMDLAPLALARLSRYKDAVIVDFEKDCSNIVLLVDGVPRGMHMVPALADGASLKDQLAQVTDKLAKMVEFYNSSRPVKPIKEPAKVLVAGELLEEEKALDYIQERIGYPVETLAAGNIPSPGFGRRYAVNAGLLEMRFDEGAKNAAPYQYLDLGKTWKEQRHRVDVVHIFKKALVPICVFAGLISLGMAYYAQDLAGDKIKTLETSYNQLNTELVRKQQAVSQAKTLQNNIDETVARIEEIKAGKEVLSSYREYVGDISTIVAALPGGVNFDSLDVSRAGVALLGSSLEAASVITFAENLENAGFKEAIVTWIDAPRSTNGSAMEIFFKIDIIKNIARG